MSRHPWCRTCRIANCVGLICSRRICSAAPEAWQRGVALMDVPVAVPARSTPLSRCGGRDVRLMLGAAVVPRALCQSCGSQG